MQAFEVFYAQTERAVNYLYILVICILPLLWFGDCKKTMSLLFKKIIPPNYKEYDIQWDFPRNLQLVLITLGVGLFFLHRTWRLRLQEERCNRIKLESAFTETHELHQLKLKLLQAVDKITMEKILQPKSSETRANPIWKPIKRTIYSMQEED
ncbi:uncharacterized protein LOC120776449 [Bactrocera tryoni]|uniref:uncharacterized protein LOC120776449 n=1 Tax=Bactrocera tryoni TaxID=59916 RepID=UPI001A98471D|nr:uncharacterized protein LOC120776449 [Bactrocera tryoni]